MSSSKHVNAVSNFENNLTSKTTGASEYLKIAHKTARMISAVAMERDISCRFFQSIERIAEVA